MLKNSVSYTKVHLHNHRQLENKSVQALVADIRSLSSLAYQDLFPNTPERLADQHFIDAFQDRADRLKLRRGKPRTLDEALSLACELEAFRLVALWMKLIKRLISLKLSWICYVMIIECNNNIRRLGKLPCSS